MSDIVGSADDAAFVVGGKVGGGVEGDFHVIVQDARKGESAQKKTPMVELDLVVKDDPDHAAKEGKGILGSNPFKARWYFPRVDDPEDKKLQQRGIMKRQLYQGFGVKWPDEEGKKFDPRIFVGKMAWVRLKTKEGEDFPQVSAVAVNKEDLPGGKKKATNGEAPAKPAGGGRRR